jgi:hypothetical protein
MKSDSYEINEVGEKRSTVVTRMGMPMTVEKYTTSHNKRNGLSVNSVWVPLVLINLSWL